jgi:hypothetical protein
MVSISDWAFLAPTNTTTRVDAEAMRLRVDIVMRAIAVGVFITTPFIGVICVELLQYTLDRDV